MTDAIDTTKGTAGALAIRVLALTDLLARNPKPSDAETRVWLDGIMCRCGVFQ